MRQKVGNQTQTINRTKARERNEAALSDCKNRNSDKTLLWHFGGPVKKVGSDNSLVALCVI